MLEISRDEYAVMSFDPESRVLELEWLDATAQMTEDDFKGSLERLAAGAEDQRPRGILVDVRRFRFVPGPEFSSWRDEHIIPRYNAAGVERFAFLVPEETAAPFAPSHEGPATFPTAYFGSRDAIEAWFRGENDLI